MSGKPTVISTFAGCGGSSLGYKMAGYRELLAVDYNKNAEETFKANFPEVPFLNIDIAELTAKDIMKLTGIKKKELDLLDGSPPCQGFSITGKRELNDPRNDLFIHFNRLIKDLQPKAFVMENVYGMVKGKMKGKFKEILATLKGSGYDVKVKLMNAVFHGVPQIRNRLIFIGYRKDLKITPSFPEKSDKIITVREALKGLKDSGETRKLRGKVSGQYYNIGIGKALADHLESKGKKGSYFNLVKIDPNRPSHTILSEFTSARSGILHWKENRFLTIAEIKRLSSFPDDFIFLGTFENQWARIGNTVPPKMMYSIAKNIKKELFNGRK